MPDKKLKRRDFLKLTVATTAAQGLSHFRFLNFAGIGDVSAHGDEPSFVKQGICEPPNEPDICSVPGEPDFCFIPGGPDVCSIPGEPDMCPGPGAPDYICQGDDLCGEFGMPDTCDQFEPDTCVPPGEPDECLPPDDPDECIPPETPEDICDPAIGEPDTSAVTMSGVEAQGSVRTVLGGVAVLVTGAVLWMKSRLPFTKSEED